jgi:2-polyprenyl-3-methyl-5-hydroxy-6-metoxy-1,4-benzoquinol methylase
MRRPRRRSYVGEHQIRHSQKESTMSRTTGSPTQTEDQTRTPSDDAALKAKHRAMWALGNYPAVASEVIASLGPVLVDAARIGPGQRVHDVAAGSGNVAIPAARTGAEVVATDLTPELLARGQEQAEAEGLTLEWVVADAEALPCDDGEFDTVVSCVGVMFAPHHQAVADHLLRVVRPGGTIALLSWTPEGFIGQMFATMKPYAPPPPPGA